MSSTATILSHRRPDLDAIVSAWMARRFLFAGRTATVRFVSQLTDKLISSAGCIVDIGKIHDRERLRFDHKEPESRRHLTCSAKLLWEHLVEQGHEVEHLRELVELVFDGDSARRRSKSPRYKESRTSGWHARLEGLRGKGWNDQAVFEAMGRELDAAFVIITDNINE